MTRANRVFSDAEARNAGSPRPHVLPGGVRRRLGLTAEAVLAERTAMRGDRLRDDCARPQPGAGRVTSIVKRLRAGETCRGDSPGRAEPCLG
jgi:hypothetical protein